MLHSIVLAVASQGKATSIGRNSTISTCTELKLLFAKRMGNLLESGKLADQCVRSNNAQTGEFSSGQSEKYIVIESGRRTTSDTRCTTTQVVPGRAQSLEESIDSGYDEPPDHQQSRLDKLQVGAPQNCSL